MDTSDDALFGGGGMGDIPITPPTEAITDKDLVDPKRRRKKLAAAVQASDFTAPILGMGGVLGLDGE